MEKNEIVQLLITSDRNITKSLASLADTVRHNLVGDDIHVRGLLNISNYCRKNCLYCGLGNHNRKLKRYRMKPEEILQTIEAAAITGYKTVLLQGGEDMQYTTEIITSLVEEIHRRFDLDIALSLGERPDDDYRRWFDAGAAKYLLKHETSDPELYRRLHPDSDFETRIHILRFLKQTGYETGSGIMIGLPGQTVESIADDILLFRELDIDMIGCGPYIYNPDTPIPEYAETSIPADAIEDMVIKVTALNRIITRDTMIPATTATETKFSARGKLNTLHSGANVIMLDITPPPWKEHYRIYPRNKFNDGIRNYQDIIKDISEKTGRPVSPQYGRRRENNR